MEKRNLLRQLLRYLYISPYNWLYTLLLPYYLFYPSKKNNSKLTPASASYNTGHTKNGCIKLVFAGDIMLLKQHRIPNLCPELVKLISSADYFAANCEACITDTALNPKAAPLITFNMPLLYLEGIFSQLSLDKQACILSFANNHSRDLEEHYFLQGMELVHQKLGIHTIGSAEQPLITLPAKNTLTLGLAAWTHLMNGERGLEARKVVTRDTDIFSSNISLEKKSKRIDYLIGMPHWDREYQHFPTQATYQQAKNFFALGFDLLVGAHSHTPQPLTWCADKLCCFSLGNFCSVSNNWHTRIVPIFELNLNSEASIASYQMHFFIQHERNKQITIEPLTALSGKEQQAVKNLLALLYPC